MVLGARLLLESCCAAITTRSLLSARYVPYVVKCFTKNANDTALLALSRECAASYLMTTRCFNSSLYSLPTIASGMRLQAVFMVLIPDYVYQIYSTDPLQLIVYGEKALSTYSSIVYGMMGVGKLTTCKAAPSRMFLHH